MQAPRARVWQALANAEAFGRWFGVDLAEFVPGARIRGQVTNKGYEHVPFDITIEAMEPERLLSWRWRDEFERGAATVTARLLDLGVHQPASRTEQRVAGGAGAS